MKRLLLFLAFVTITQICLAQTSGKIKRDTFPVFALYILDSTEQNETGRFYAIYENGKPAYFVRQKDKVIFLPSKILLHRRIF